MCWSVSGSLRILKLGRQWSYFFFKIALVGWLKRLGNFILGLTGMRSDGLDGVSIREEHPAYIRDMVT